MSKTNLALLLAYQRGYRIVNEVIFNDKGKIVPGYISGGYRKFSVIIANSVMNVKVHRFVALQKFGDEIFNKGVLVRHLDGNPLNNREDNIEIGSVADNSYDRDSFTRLAHAYKASLNNQTLGIDTVRLIKLDRESGMSYSDIGKKYSVPVTNIYYLINKSIIYNNPELFAKLSETSNFKSSS